MADLRSLTFSLDFKGSASPINRMNDTMDKMKQTAGGIKDKVVDWGKAYKKADDETNPLKDSLRTIGTLAASAFAIDKLKDFGISAVESAAEATAMNAQFDQVFGDVGGQAQATIDDMANQFGMVPNRLKPSMSQMTSMFKGLGLNTEDAMGKATDAVTISADAAAFYDKSFADANGALTSFIKGNYEGGESIGLFANDTQMAAYAMEKGLVGATSEWAQLDEATKQATRMEYAQNMQELAGATGQAARESDGYQNQIGNVQQAWKDFLAIVGGPILDSVVGILKSITDGLKYAGDNAGGVTDKIGGFVGIVIEKVPQVIDFIGKIAPILAGIGTALLLYQGYVLVTSGITAAWTAAQWLLNVALNANPIGIIILAIAALVGGIIYLWNTNEDFRNGIIAIWEGIKGAFVTAVEAVQGAWGSVVGFFEGIITGIQNAFNGVSKFIIDSFNGAVTFLQDLPNKALEWAGDMMKGFIDGIKNGISAVGDAIKGVADKITSFLHFSRPDEGPLREYETWMPDMMQGLASGITNNVGMVKAALNGMTGQMSAKVTGEVSSTTAATSSGGGGVMNFSPQITVNVNGGGQVKESFSSIEQQLNLFMDEYAQKMALRNPKVAY
jgi:hypothetical protein